MRVLSNDLVSGKPVELFGYSYQKWRLGTSDVGERLLAASLCFLTKIHIVHCPPVDEGMPTAKRVMSMPSVLAAALGGDCDDGFIGHA